MKAVKSVHLKAYLGLERVMLMLDNEADALALAFLSDTMDVLWRDLSDEEHALLDKRGQARGTGWLEVPPDRDGEPGPRYFFGLIDI